MRGAEAPPIGEVTGLALTSKQIQQNNARNPRDSQRREH